MKAQHFTFGEIEFSDAVAKQFELPKRMPVVEAEMSVELQRKLGVATVKLPALKGKS